MLSGFERLSGGYLNVVYKNKDIVYTRLKDRPTVSDPIDSRFETSVKFLETFGGDIAPKLIDANKDKYRIAMSLLPGGNLRNIISELDSNKDRETINNAYFQIGKMIKKVHSTEHPKKITPDVYSSEFEELIMKDFYTLKDFNESLENPPFNTNAMESILTENVIPSINKIICSYKTINWVHADFWTNNAIAEIKNGGININGLIDAEFAKPGIPEEDLAQIFMWEFDETPEFIEPFREGYGNIKIENIKPFYIANCLNYLRPITLDYYLEEARKQNPSEEFYHKHINILANTLESIYENELSPRIV